MFIIESILYKLAYIICKLFLLNAMCPTCHPGTEKGVRKTKAEEVRLKGGPDLALVYYCGQCATLTKTWRCQQLQRCVGYGGTLRSSYLFCKSKTILK